MGFSMIETYMPWSVHETAPGEFDFGETDPARDVGRFLDICHSQGVRVIARTGTSAVNSTGAARPAAAPSVAAPAAAKNSRRE